MSGTPLLREITATSLRTGFNILAIILLALGTGFSFGLPQPAAWIALATAIFMAIHSIWLSLRVLEPRRYVYSGFFRVATFLTILTGWVFALTAMRWSDASWKIVIGIWATQVLLLTSGFLIGRARLDGKQQRECLKQFIQFHSNGYRLANRLPNWALYTRQFRPRALEVLARTVGAVCLIISAALALAGGGSAPALVAVVEGLGLESDPHFIVMVVLSVPSLFGLGYLQASLVGASRAWADITRGRGLEYWADEV